MRRLTLAVAVLLPLVLGHPAFAEEEDEPRQYPEDFPRVNKLMTGLNGMITWPTDPLMFAVEGPEVFDEVWNPPVTGRILGFGAGLMQAPYRLMMGACDVLFAPITVMPMLSPMPRYKVFPFQHDDE